MSKHTPGPWVVRGAYIGAGECDLAMMTRPNPNDSEAIAEWGANTRLMAAAPKLKDALEYLLESTERPPEPNCSCHIFPPCSDCVDYSGLREAVAIAEEALAQAAGGEA